MKSLGHESFITWGKLDTIFLFKNPWRLLWSWRCPNLRMVWMEPTFRTARRPLFLKGQNNPPEKTRPSIWAFFFALVTWKKTQEVIQLPPLKFDSSPLKSCLANRKGSSSFPTIFQRRAVKLLGCNLFTSINSPLSLDQVFSPCPGSCKKCVFSTTSKKAL